MDNEKKLGRTNTIQVLSIFMGFELLLGICMLLGMPVVIVVIFTVSVLPPIINGLYLSIRQWYRGIPVRWGISD